MIPYLIQQNEKKVLMVHDKPYVMIAGEIHNSSSSSLEYMAEIWPRLKTLNLNSVLIPVTWQLIEPEEGVFDWTLVDGIIEQARSYRMKIGFLWFGSWKNAQCSYVPDWVKADTQRFERVEVEKGVHFKRIDFEKFTMPYTTLSAFCEETCKADAKAFRALMEHIQEMDGEENTVIMMQVENETGFLGTARERSDLADQLFAEKVPAELLKALKGKELAYEVLAEEGNWETVFGNNAEEVFSAYYVASFVEKVAKAGKEVYPLPMAANCWLEQSPTEPAGGYPSGGPLARMMEIWKYAAPSIDICAPDIYLPNFTEICGRYVKLGNPLFIPETSGRTQAGPREVYSVGHHHALCFSPFAIEDLVVNGEMTENVARYSKINNILNEMIPVLTENYGTHKLQAVHKEDADHITMAFDHYEFTVQYSFWSREWDEGCCLISQISDHEFWVLGCGCLAEITSKIEGKPYVEYMRIEEGVMQDGQWKVRRILNGDEEKILLSEPAILKVKLHAYN